MAGRVLERLAHRGLGVLDGALAIARDAVIDPGVGPHRVQPNGFGKGTFGFDRVALGQPCLAIHVVGLRKTRAPLAGFARRVKRVPWLVEGKLRNRGVQERDGIIGQELLRRREEFQCVVVVSGPLQGDAEIELGQTVLRIGADGTGEQFDRFGKCVFAQARDTFGTQNGNLRPARACSVFAVINGLARGSRHL